MKAERWAQVDRLLDEVLALPPDERADFLAGAAGGDEELLGEVLSLLAAYDRAASRFLAAPALEVAAHELAEQSAVSLIGSEFGPYKILSVLGVGGMGEVYLAQDQRLRRKLALKLLPRQFVQDATRIERFTREARAVSVLNHPNIVTVYDIGEHDGTHFLAMEYVAGQTLREHCEPKRPPLKEAIEIGLQITAALSAAHEAGIVHRDIKPENVMLRSDGLVKVLDFGLAKLTEAKRREATTQGHAADLARTKPGVVMGTINYMSPEQAQGLEVDQRSDVFSLGVLLYEMLAGALPFKGLSTAAVLDAIVHHQPLPLRQIKSDLSPELERIISHALEKDPELRYQSIADLRAELKQVQKALDSAATDEVLRQTTGSISPAKPAARRKIVFAASAIVVAATAGLLWWLIGSNRSASADDWAEAKFVELTEFPGTKTHPTLSPDGQHIVYTRRVNNQFDLFRQRVGGSNAQNLTEGNSAVDTEPSFSPDGNLIAFRSERDGGGVYLIGATGENLRLVAKGGFNPSWSPDGSEIIYATQSGSSVFQRVGIASEIWAVNWQTGVRRHIPAGPDAVQPRWSPNRHRIAYWGLRNASQRDIWTIPAAGGEPVAVTDDAAEDGSPVWSHDGRYLYFSSNRNGRLSLWRVRIDEMTGKTLGNPQPLSVPSLSSTFLTISRDGKRMAYASRLIRTNIRRVPFDPVRGVVTGEPEWVTQITRRATNQNVSPDGEWLTFFSYGDPQFDIYVSKIGSAEIHQLTNDRFRDRAPRWSPDGQRIAFFSDLSGKFEIWTINRDGSNRQQLTFSAPNQPGFLDPAWSPDSTRMLFSLRGGGESFIMDLSRSFQAQTLFVFPPLPNGGGKFTAYNWSPDSQRIVGSEWQKDRDIGGLVIYDLAAQKYERINSEGDSSYWLPDNRHLLYAYNQKIYLIDSQTRVARELLSATEDTLENPTLSRDGRFLYYGVNNNEESVYLISLN